MLDFYRGTLSSRRVAVLVKHLPRESALVRALSDGQPPFSRLEHLVADVWALWAKKDHPQRAALAEKQRAAENIAKVIKLRSVYEKRQRRYGLSGGDVT